MHHLRAAAIPGRFVACGLALTGGMSVLAATRAHLGTPLFMSVLVAVTAAYIVATAAVRSAAAHPAPTMRAIWLLAIAMRVPLASAPIEPASDMTRYVWDGRVQRAGLNPYAVRPSDPELAYLHDDHTRAMNSPRMATPYPPVAQLFFRLVTGVSDSAFAIRLALVLCDLLTIAVIARWLGEAGRDPRLVVAYAWHPLVVMEVAMSGHIDALGVLLAVAALRWLWLGRSMLATIALGAAVGVKYVPAVLLPLLWRRARLRDFAVAGLALAAIVAPYLVSGAPGPRHGTPVSSTAQGAASAPARDGSNGQAGEAAGSWRVRPGLLDGVNTVVGATRFNGPVFRAVRSVTSPQVASALALLLGLGVAAFVRAREVQPMPERWVWPVAVGLACAPVVYPWYLLWLTPAAMVPAAAPLVGWTLTVPLVYVVWAIAPLRAMWRVPATVEAAQYLAMAVGAVLAFRTARRAKTRTSEPAAGGRTALHNDARHRGRGDGRDDSLTSGDTPGGPA